jgi:hypothetical protein
MTITAYQCACRRPSPPWVPPPSSICILTLNLKRWRLWEDPRRQWLLCARIDGHQLREEGGDPNAPLHGPQNRKKLLQARSGVYLILPPHLALIYYRYINMYMSFQPLPEILFVGGRRRLHEQCLPCPAQWVHVWAEHPVHELIWTKLNSTKIKKENKRCRAGTHTLFSACMRPWSIGNSNNLHFNETPFFI